MTKKVHYLNMSDEEIDRLTRKKQQKVTTGIIPDIILGLIFGLCLILALGDW